MKRFTQASHSPEVTERELANRKTAYELALESIVLLENPRGAVPLEAGDIALYGAGARHTIKGGTGSGEVNERYSVSICDGLANAGFRILTGGYLDRYDRQCEEAKEAWIASHKGIPNLHSLADTFTPPSPCSVDEEFLENCEAAVYVVARQAGEGKDRRLEGHEFSLTERELEELRTLSGHYRTLVLVINCGASMDLSFLEDIRVDAVFYYCQQGEEGGNAFADLLKGKASPSGRLTATWPKKYEDVYHGGEYSYLGGDLSRQRYGEGIYVGYRYFDAAGVEPAYRFGYGLSYTSFDVRRGKLSLEGTKAEVSFIVANTGSRKGKETVQLYATPAMGRLVKEKYRLIGFEKTKELEPGESEELRISFDVRDMASYDPVTASWILEEGDYGLFLGGFPEGLKEAGCIRLDRTAVTAKLRNICPLQGRLEELELPREDYLPGENTEILFLDSDAVETEQPEYGKPPVHHDPETDEIMKKLTLKEMVSVLVGEGVGGMISTKKNYVPGAVGRTESGLYRKGLINVNLADGPAGVRLLRESAVSPKGRLKFVRGSNLLGVMEIMPEGLMKMVRAKEGRDALQYQYCTAFPVGTAIAQTWNRELMEAFGRAVSAEMSEYGITFWLAPGMNIQRNPLCGRNFEYYSEDPVLSGVTAACVTRGVQSTPGNYVTIKHFACNSNEDNRNYCDSVVGERALREIYLRGFGIAVKEGGAKALMTSYNKINGVYAPDSLDLCTHVLRNEWGFDGVVMTDWFSTGGRKGRTDEAIAAGNDLIMPGGGSFRKEILKGLKNGSVSEEDVRRACANIVRSIVHSDQAKRVKAADLAD
jgi:beta-glucosidase